MERVEREREREREMVSNGKRMEPHIRHDILLLLFSKFTQDIDDSFHISQFSPSFIMPLKTCLVNNNLKKASDFILYSGFQDLCLIYLIIQHRFNSKIQSYIL